MARRLGWSVLVALAVVGTAQGAAPPAQPKVRLLSLREALSLAVERAGREAGIAPDADDPEPPGRDVVRRRCAAGHLTHEQRRVLHQAILNAEVAYWNLAGAYWTLQSQEWGWRSASEALGVTAVRFLLGRAGVADFQEARGHCELFRVQRQAAITDVRQNEKQLRELLGLAKGGPLLIPADVPGVACLGIDWESDLRDALARRPELALARQNVEASKGKGRLALARALEELKDQERKTTSFLSVQYRRVSNHHEQILANRAQRLAFGEQLRVRRLAFLAGRGTLDVLLEAQRFWAAALANEFQHLTAYNNALVGYDFARGLSLHRAHLVGSKTPLLSPDKERKRAAVTDATAKARTTKTFRPGDDLKTIPSLASLWQSAPDDLVAKLGTRK